MTVWNESLQPQHHPQPSCLFRPMQVSSHSENHCGVRYFFSSPCRRTQGVEGLAQQHFPQRILIIVKCGIFTILSITSKKNECDYFTDGHWTLAIHYMLHINHCSRNSHEYTRGRIFWGMDFIHTYLFTDHICSPRIGITFHPPLCAFMFITNGILRHYLINIHLFNIFTEVPLNMEDSCFYPFNIIYSLLSGVIKVQSS